MTGFEPASMIDHINGNPFDNRWANLRSATASQNGYNIGNRQRIHKHLPKGVYQKRPNMYVAQIKLGRRNIHLGSFKTPAAAHKAWCKAAKAAHGQFFNPGVLHAVTVRS